MVKPIPANIPTPITCFQFARDGSLANLALTAIQENSVTPIVLPKNSPSMMPYPSGDASPANIPFSKVIFVF